MPKFRKKPVEIEARRHTGREGSARKIVSWIQQGGGAEATFHRIDVLDDFNVGIHTLEGTMIASPGDWVIRGVQGEFYPCKPDIFAATYDAVA